MKKIINFRNIIICLLFFANISITLARPPGWEVVDIRPDASPEYEYSYYFDIKCADSLNCIAWANIYTGGYYLRRTTDGGKTWKTVYMDSAYYTGPNKRYEVADLQEISYPDTNLFIAIADSGYVLRTTDKGETWQKYNFGIEKVLFKLRMLDKNYGILGIGSYPIDRTKGYLYETTDGGLTWLPLNYLYRDFFFQEIELIDKETMYCIALVLGSKEERFYSYIAKNNFSYWDTVGVIPDFLPYMDFVDEENGWVCGGRRADLNDYSTTYQKIAHTSDGGRTWEYQRNQKFNGWSLNGVKFYDKNFGMVTSGGGLILMTFDGGKNWKEEYLYKIPDKDPAFGYIDGLQIPSATTAYCIYDGDSIFKYTRDLTGIEEFPENNNGMTINISPNPAGEYIKISGLNKGLQPLVPEQEIKIYNLLGECVINESIHPMTPSHRMNIENLPAGVYFLRVGDWTGRFVKI